MIVFCIVCHKRMETQPVLFDMVAPVARFAFHLDHMEIGSDVSGTCEQLMITFRRTKTAELERANA